MNKKSKERLHLFRQVEEVLREMNQSEVKECSEATLQSMKHIYKELRIALLRVEVARIERLKDEGKMTPKEAVHRKSLLRKRWR
jgi:sensor c-di-GMP phosphodiesterase-like protein